MSKTAPHIAATRPTIGPRHTTSLPADAIPGSAHDGDGAGAADASGLSSAAVSAPPVDTGTPGDHQPRSSVRVVTRRPRNPWQLPLLACAPVFKTLATCVAPTLGPAGGDVAVTQDTGRVLLTNNGVSILEVLRVHHPLAKYAIDTAIATAVNVGT